MTAFEIELAELCRKHGMQLSDRLEINVRQPSVEKSLHQGHVVSRLNHNTEITIRAKVVNFGEWHYKWGKVP